MINLPLTKEIQEFLATPTESRDYAYGATLLGRASRNRVLYANVSRNPDGRAAAINYHLQKILDTRLADVTREQVAAMMVTCKSIAETHGLEFEASGKTAFQKGKRADHDSLPSEIQDLYVENGEIRQRMRDCHTHLRLIDSSNSTCPDSDRYPFAKELIALDKRYRANWNLYDHYIKGTPVSSTTLGADPRTSSANAARTAHMLLGKYARRPDATLAARISDVYSKISSPSPALTEKMRAAGLL